MLHFYKKIFIALLLYMQKVVGQVGQWDNLEKAFYFQRVKIVKLSHW